MDYNSFSVLLSASVPSKKRSKKYQEEYTKIANAQMQIEEAVIALCRNIFSAGGNIVFGGHPSISPLVVMVATEFSLDSEAENIKRAEHSTIKPVTIFQSRAYEDSIREASPQLFAMGHSNRVWTEAQNGEKYIPEITDTPQCTQSLRYMRDVMIRRDIDAMVCMGGMEGVEQEFEMFRDYHREKPVFLLESTGGATKILAEKYSGEENVRLVEKTIKYKTSIEDYRQREEQQTSKGYEDNRGPGFELIPYSYITAVIVKEIMTKGGRGRDGLAQ
jgi:hypothetical protein